MASIGGITEILACVVYEQSVRSGEQWDCGGFLILSSIPNDTAGLLNTHVGCEGVDLRVQTAGGDDIDCRWRDRQRRVVPHKGDILSDLVVGCGRGGGGDHGHTTSRGGRVDRNRSGGSGLAGSCLCVGAGAGSLACRRLVVGRSAGGCAGGGCSGVGGAGVSLRGSGGGSLFGGFGGR